MAGAMASRLFMSDLLPQLILLAVGGSIAPPLLLLTILFLGSQRSLSNATALVVGTRVGRRWDCRLSCRRRGRTGSTAPRSTVLSARGRRAAPVLGPRTSQHTDPYALHQVAGVGELQTRLERLDRMVLSRSDQEPRVFIACINLIATASFSPQGSIVALVLVLLIFAIPVLVLIGLYTAVPQRAANMLVSLRAWMEKHNRTITVVLCFVFGVFFLVRGFSGL